MSKTDMDLKGVGEGIQDMKFSTCSFRRDGITMTMGYLGAEGPMMTDFTAGIVKIVLLLPLVS
jgi:hypothetical protein